MPSEKPRQNSLWGLLLAAGGAILFASKGLFAKALYREGVDFETLTAVRAVIALPLFWLLASARGLQLRQLPPRALLLAAGAGVACYSVGALVDFHALELIDVSIERSLLFSYPALVVFYTALRDRRMPSGALLGAVAMTYGGILLVVGVFDAGAWNHNLSGSLLVLFCATTTALYFLLGERCIAELGSLTFTIVAMVAATIGVVLYFLAGHAVTVLAQHSPRAWLLLLGLAVLCMFLPTLMQAEGIRRVGAVRGSLASTIGPPAALFLGTLLLGERPGLWQLLGTAMIVTGILIISRRGPADRA